MEQWEIDLRAKLDKALPNKIYELKLPNGYFATGKKGYIEFRVSLMKEANKNKLGKGIIEQLTNKDIIYTKGEISKSKLDKIVNEVFNNKNMNKVDIKIVNKSNNALPQYETLGSAGMDIRAYITADNATLVKDRQLVTIINPGKRAMIHTGLYMEVAKGYEMQVRARSGLAYKKGIMITNGVGTIDSDYRGECNVLLINQGDEPFEIRNGDRIAQFVLKESPQANFIEVDSLDETDRGEGGFGSTGK